MFFLVIETIQMRKDSRDKTRDLRETIESGPLCITDLFQNKSVAYFSPKQNTFKIFLIFSLSTQYVTFQCEC